MLRASRDYMHLSFCIFFILFFCDCEAINVCDKDAHCIADKIWKNECGGKVEGLTTWNKGENFASMGIGHFLWYPDHSDEPFQESFPQLLTFLKKENATLPMWLTPTTPCPWQTREEFYAHIQSPEMISLRTFLFETKKLQAIFIAKQLETALSKMSANLSTEEKTKITVVFYKLTETANGLYALIDYLNFKGLGIATKESYQGQGWGLKQVLLDMPTHSPDLVAAFVASATKILTQRVKNSPVERNEEKWLIGWLNRLKTYQLN